MSREKGLINNKQFRDILICIMWPATINYGSGILAREVGRDMWISGIISVLTVLPFIIITIKIGQNFPDKTIVEYSTSLLGTVLGKVLGLLISLYFFLFSSHFTTIPIYPYLLLLYFHLK